MSDNQPVAYPSLGAAYPVNKAAYPVAPPVPAFKPAEVAEPIEQVAEVSAPKFFPLVPTSSSKFVSQDALPIAQVESVFEPIEEAASEPISEPISEPDAAWASIDKIADELHIEVDELTVTEVENLFDISPSLTPEPQTNSIVLDSIPDVLTSSETFSDAGEILVTGSIELPTLTGEVALVNESPEADTADALDSASVTISTVAPVRAPSVVNSKAQLGVLPSKRRRSQGQLMAMLTLGLLIITVGTLYVMASILGIIE
jgi:hypothetical protein